MFNYGLILCLFAQSYIIIMSILAAMKPDLNDVTRHQFEVLWSASTIDQNVTFNTSLFCSTSQHVQQSTRHMANTLYHVNTLALSVQYVDTIPNLGTRKNVSKQHVLLLGVVDGQFNFRLGYFIPFL